MKRVTRIFLLDPPSGSKVIVWASSRWRWIWGIYLFVLL